MKDDFTPKAQTFWNALPEEAKGQLLNTVWCSSCGGVRTIVGFTGRVEHGDLILQGKCGTCGGLVARVIERA